MTQSIVSVMDRIEAEQATVISIGPNGTSLDLLQAVYRNSALDLHVRMRAAGMAIAYEMPKLMAVAQINEQSFAEVLERRLKRLSALERNPPVMIEAKPVKENGGNVDARLPPSIPDKRFRRM